MRLLVRMCWCANVFDNIPSERQFHLVRCNKWFVCFIPRLLLKPYVTTIINVRYTYASASTLTHMYISLANIRVCSCVCALARWRVRLIYTNKCWTRFRPTNWSSNEMLEQTKRRILFFSARTSTCMMVMVMVRPYDRDGIRDRETEIVNNIIYLLFSCVANSTMWPVSGSMPKMTVKNRRTFRRFHRIEIFGLPFLCSSSTFVSLTLIKRFAIVKRVRLHSRIRNTLSHTHTE